MIIIKPHCVNSAFLSLFSKKCRLEIFHRVTKIELHSRRFYSVNLFDHDKGNPLYVNKLSYSNKHSLLRHFNKGSQGNLNYIRPYSVDTGSWITWFSQTQLVLMSQNFLQTVHDVTHLPWWLTIIMATALLRVAITFPFTVYQHVIVAKFQNLQPEIKELASKLKEETIVASKMYNWNESYAKYMYNRSLKKRIVELIIRDNCHPFKSSLVMWIQLPMWLSFSCAFRNMSTMMPTRDFNAEITFLELASGGFGWIPNLTAVDASLILPVLLGVINLAIIEIHALKPIKVNNKFRTVVNYFMRGVSIIMIPIAASVPSCMALYWTVSSIFGLVQNICLSYPSVRRACFIPPTAEESQTPWKDIASNIEQKLKKFK